MRRTSSLLPASPPALASRRARSSSISKISRSKGKRDSGGIGPSPPTNAGVRPDQTGSLALSPRAVQSSRPSTRRRGVAEELHAAHGHQHLLEVARAVFLFLGQHAEDQLGKVLR